MGIEDGHPPGERAHLPASSHLSLLLVLRCVLMPSAFLLGDHFNLFCFGNRIAAWPPPPRQPSTATQRPHRRREVRHMARQKGLQATLLYGLWPCLAAVRSAIVAPNLHWGAAWGAGRRCTPPQTPPPCPRAASWSRCAPPSGWYVARAPTVGFQQRCSMYPNVPSSPSPRSDWPVPPDRRARLHRGHLRLLGRHRPRRIR